MKRFWMVMMALAAILALAGCGGSGGGGSDNGGGGGGGGTTPPPEKKAAFKLGVNWSERSRAATGPSSALSVVAIVRTPGSAFEDVQVIQDRRDDPAAYSETLVSRQQALVGDHDLIVRFYASKKGNGAIVASAALAVKLLEDGTLVQRNGQPLGNISLEGAIATVEVDPDVQVEEDSTRLLTFTAKNAQGGVVAVSQGSGFFELVSGAGIISLDKDGMITALKAGTAQVRVRVDGKVSAPQTVTVYAKRLAVTTQVSWPERSREIIATRSALSVRLVLKGAGVSGQDVVVLANRRTDPAAYTEDLTSNEPALIDQFQLEAKFYAQPDQKGDLVSSALVPVRVNRQTGELNNPDGTKLNVVVGERTIKTVEVPAQNVVRSGTTQTLSFVAKDKDGKVVTVTRGSAVWTVVAGGDKLSVTKDGVATGNEIGLAQVVVDVDGVKSAPSVVRVVQALTDFEVAISWPERSRVAESTASALSAVIFLRDDTPGAPNREYEFNVNRRTAPAAYVETYNVLRQAPTGSWFLSITYYAQPDQGGDVVSKAIALVQLKPDGTLVAPDGSPLGDIPVLPRVTQVTVDDTAPIDVEIGRARQLVATVQDAQGIQFVVTPGSFFWSFVPDQDPDPATIMTLSKDGIAAGLRKGTVNVRATMDGVSDDAALVVDVPFP